MGIIGNQTLESLQIGGGATGNSMHSNAWNLAGINSVEAFSDYEASPEGSSGTGFILPAKSGRIASRNLVRGSGQPSNANLAGGINVDADLAGSGSISDANMNLLILASASILANSSLSGSAQGAVNLESNISGSGAITNALPFVIAEIVAAINASGIMAGPSMTTAINIVAVLEGSGSISNTSVELLGALTSDIIASSSVGANGNNAYNILATINAGGSLTQADLRAIADMALNVLGVGSASMAQSASPGIISANITPFTELSPQTLSKAVWDQKAVDNNLPDTMGYVLNNVSTGGVNVNDIAEAVWSQLKVNSNDPDTMGELMNQIHAEVLKRLKKADFLALK